jgi:hypothetical protein
MKPDKVDRRIVTAFVLILWAAAAWLLYPLVVLDRVDPSNVKTFLYRSALGLTLLIVFFGKTLFDLIYPWVVGRKIPARDAALLTAYLLALTFGIVFMIVRLVLVYLKSHQAGGGVIF